MQTFELTSCDQDSEWEQFLLRSPQGSRYTSKPLLEALGCEADQWLVMRNAHPVAAVPVITRNNASTGLPIHTYYVGPMIHEEAWRGKDNRRTENLWAITEFIMQELSQRYTHIEFSLHPDITDIRGFDWFNYHQPDKGRVTILPRYTARIKLDDEHIRTSARSSRRREENYAQKREGLQVSFDGTIDELLHLWQSSLDRQDTKIPGPELVATTAFARYLLDNKLGTIAVSRDEQGVAQAVGLMMYDHHGLAHLPVVGTSETRYGGTQLYFALMDHALASGFRVLDFNGANSPKRGYFKHSIGGDTTLYFHTRWTRPA